jgi:hypothetical protein
MVAGCVDRVGIEDRIAILLEPVQPDELLEAVETMLSRR